jgi:Tol biopolymer transport system component
MWIPEGDIVFGVEGQGFYRVAADGGSPLLVLALDRIRQEQFYGYPSLLPDGRHFIYLTYSTITDNAGVYLASLEPGSPIRALRRLVGDLSVPVYAPSATSDGGYLLFSREGTLVAQALDPSRLEVQGDPIPLGVPARALSAAFSASRTGMLVYSEAGSPTPNRLTWYDRQGRPQGEIGQPGEFQNLALSPDGGRAAFYRQAPARPPDLYLIELSRGGTTRLTSDPFPDFFPTWSPDGKQIAFISRRNGTDDLYLRKADGSGADELLLKSNNVKIPSSWSPDGRLLLFTIGSPKTKSDLWVLPLDDRRPAPVLETEFDEADGQFSPDGRWIAFVSDMSGKYEIYVQPFPLSPTSGRSLISEGGGFRPRWRRDSKEIIYASGEGKVMAVDVTTAPVFRAGAPRTLFSSPDFAGGARTWDITRDGQGFLVSARPELTEAIPLTVVVNWEAGLKR